MRAHFVVLVVIATSAPLSMSASCKGGAKKADTGEAPATNPPETANDAATATARPATANDAAAAPGCDERLKAARALAKAKKHAEAIAAFEAISEGCADLPDDKKLWLHSDLAFEHFRAGDKEACWQVISAAAPKWAAASPKAAKALLHNAGLCRAKPEGDYCDHKLDDSDYCQLALALDEGKRSAFAGATRPPCSIEGAPKNAVKVPGAGDRCLSLSESEGSFDVDDESSATCPAVTLHGPGGKKSAVATSGALASTSDCCNIGVLEVLDHAALGPVVILRSDGPSRDCFGGTATVDYFEVYKLEGGALDGVADLSISWH